MMVIDLIQTSEEINNNRDLITNPEKSQIYIVDDDESVRRALKRLFKSLGMAAETFDSAAGFLNLTTLESRSCLVLDVKMPDIDGIELQEILKNENIKIPVIFISAYDDNEIQAKAMKGGARAFLCKPVNDELLMAEVFSALGIENKESLH